MEKENEKTYNGSYLYRLNQELSGQQELAPYFVTSAADDKTDPEQQDPAGFTGEEEDLH